MDTRSPVLITCHTSFLVQLVKSALRKERTATYEVEGVTCSHVITYVADPVLKVSPWLMCRYCVLRLARIDGPVEQGGPLLVGANTSRHVTSSRRHLSQGRACDTRLQVDTSLEAEDEEQEEPEHKPCSQS